MKISGRHSPNKFLPAQTETNIIQNRADNVDTNKETRSESMSLSESELLVFD